MACKTDQPCFLPTPIGASRARSGHIRHAAVRRIRTEETKRFKRELVKEKLIDVPGDVAKIKGQRRVIEWIPAACD